MAKYDSGLRKTTRQMTEFNRSLRAVESIIRTERRIEKLSGGSSRMPSRLGGSIHRHETAQRKSNVDLRSANVPEKPETMEQWIAKKDFSSDQVKAIQSRISKAFPELTVEQTGKYDEKTIAAVQYAQTRFNEGMTEKIKVDGKYGDETEKLLNKKIADAAVIPTQANDKATSEPKEE